MIIKDKTFIIKVEFIFFSRYLILDFDCEDKSDEFQCEGIKITNDYAKEILPVNENRDPVIIHINVSINSFPVIDTKNVKFSSDFWLHLRWHDLRLSFWNLSNNTILNR